MTFATVKADIARYTRGPVTISPHTLRTLLNCYGLQALLVYRLGRFLQARSRTPLWWPLLPIGWIMYAFGALIARKGYGIWLDLSADIGPGLYIGHFAGIEVANCRLGSQCNIAMQSQIGDRNQKTGPRIGSRVWIGGHSKVLGPVAIGDGATIGAGSHVREDVPPQALVMGQPARVVSRRYDNSRIL